MCVRYTYRYNVIIAASTRGDERPDQSMYSKHVGCRCRCRCDCALSDGRQVPFKEPIGLAADNGVRSVGGCCGLAVSPDVNE